MSLKNKNEVNPNRPKRVAIVLANPSVSTTAGWPVGRIFLNRILLT